MDDATLTKRICELLDAIPTFDYFTAPSPGGVAVFYGRIDPEPNRAVGVRVYATTDEPNLSWRRAQIRIRGDKRRRDDADRIAGVVFAALQGLSRTGGISGIRRESMSPGGADETGREERTDNYVIVLDNPEADA